MFFLREFVVWLILFLCFWSYIKCVKVDKKMNPLLLVEYRADIYFENRTAVLLRINSYCVRFEVFQFVVICRPSLVTTLVREKRSPPLIKEVSLGDVKK